MGSERAWGEATHDVALGSHWRPPTGSAVVLLNAIGADERAWNKLGIDGAHVVTYPGHGARRPSLGWGVADIADEVVSTLDGALHIVGVGCGASIALNVLVRYPLRVRSALLVCGGAAQSEDAADGARREWLMDLGRRATREGMTSVVEVVLTDALTPFAVRTRQSSAEYLRSSLIRMDPDAWNDACIAEATAPYVSLNALSEISAPVTLVAGTHDPSRSFDQMNVLHRLIPCNRFELLSSPRMAHIEAPEDIRSAIERHFAWLAGPSTVTAPIGTSGWPNRSVSEMAFG